MSTKLTMVVVGTSGTGPVLGTTPFSYEVQGLPKRQRAWIAEFKPHWKILREQDGVQGTWTGEYDAPESALQHLQTEQTPKG